MKITLESTTKTVYLKEGGALHGVPARVWEGHTASGIAVHAFITRIAVHKDADASQFEAELKECRTPSADVQAIPMRMIL